MDLLIHHLENINWWAVVLATLVGWILGSLWYSPMLFFKPWLKASGMKPKDMKGSMAKPFVVSAVMTFVAATGLATLMCALGFNNWMQGATFGALVGLIFVAAIATIHCMFDRRKGTSTVYFIDNAYNVVLLTIVGGIIGAW